MCIEINEIDEARDDLTHRFSMAVEAQERFEEAREWMQEIAENLQNIEALENALEELFAIFDIKVPEGSDE